MLRTEILHWSNRHHPLRCELWLYVHDNSSKLVGLMPNLYFWDTTGRARGTSSWLTDKQMLSDPLLDHAHQILTRVYAGTTLRSARKAIVHVHSSSALRYRAATEWHVKLNFAVSVQTAICLVEYRVNRFCSVNGTWGDSVYTECIDVLRTHQRCISGYCRTVCAHRSHSAISF